MENSNQRSLDIQFTGFSIEYLIESNGMVIKSLLPSDPGSNLLKAGEEVMLSIDRNNLRLLKK